MAAGIVPAAIIPESRKALITKVERFTQTVVILVGRQAVEVNHGAPAECI